MTEGGQNAGNAVIGKKSTKTERLAVSFESGTVNLDEALENAKSESLEKMDDLKGAFVGNHQKVLKSSAGPTKIMRSLTSKQRVEASDGDSDSIASCSIDGDRPTRRREKKASDSVSSQKRLEVATPASDRDSIGSNESAWRTEKSRLSAIIDKAKSKGRKLVSSHKSKKDSDDKESIDEACQIITVGEDALEADVDLQNTSRDTVSSTEVSKSRSTLFDWFSTKEEDNGNGSQPQPFFFHFLIARVRDMPLMRHRFIIFIALVAITYCSPGFITGFIWGLYISFVGFLFFFVAEPVNKDLSLPKEVLINIGKELEEKKSSKNVLYEGWMNELRGRYNSASYHVNQAQTVLVRLDGKFLRVSRPARTVLKHAFHTDPTLTEVVPTFTSQSIYDLTGAEVTLRPRRLARRRWWSRKYPIHIRLLSKDKETSAPALRKTFSAQNTTEIAVSASEEEFSDDEAAVKQRQKDDEVQEYDSQGSSSDDIQEKPQRIRKKSRASSVDDIHSGSNSVRARGPCLYFFVRSAREKERWFHRLREACSQYAVKTEETLGHNVKEGEMNSTASSLRRASLPSFMGKSDPMNINFEYFLYISNFVQFKKCISEVIKTSVIRKSADNGDVSMDLGRNKWSSGEPDTDSQLVMSANALAARIFYDFCRDSYWVKQVQNKIQSKLATIHLPYFIETLELSSLDLGIVSPEIKAVYAPILDDWGLWIDFQMKYRGGIHLALETKVNLMKLKHGMQKKELHREVSKMKASVRVHHYSDSDLPESPESSPDEDFGSKTEKPAPVKESTGKKILNVVDKIASSNIFQGASELKPVKKMMEEISSTRLLLNVDVTHLEGIMTVNIPPPPSDRLWYAFRTPPKLSIRSVPQVGDRSVDMTTVSSWIENKLRLLLEKFLVCPNMDDIIVPVMSGNELLKRGYNC